MRYTKYVDVHAGLLRKVDVGEPGSSSGQYWAFSVLLRCPLDLNAFFSRKSSDELGALTYARRGPRVFCAVLCCAVLMVHGCLCFVRSRFRFVFRLTV